MERIDKVKEVKIVVATHKKYQMPEDDMYLPLHVGGEGKDDIGFAKDNSGDNISIKNPYFCELTGLYWAWKNLNSEYIGLVHYRRYFSNKNTLLKNEDEKFKRVLNKEELEKLLEKNDIILTKPRNYYIENVYDHYKHTMYIKSLDVAGEIIKEKYSEYYAEFENLKKTTKLHAFNMFVMKKEYLDEYCTWLFDILFELEKRIDFSEYDEFHSRFFGRVSERLLDVWIKTKKYHYSEIKVINMQKVNWFKKGGSFLLAKFTGKRYNRSF
ncbi:MAG: DUF4422 domain-containing protein [Clostridia bacterium]|nr:DUF4422 domain-containing protein [Clostridia bacterium]